MYLRKIGLLLLICASICFSGSYGNKTKLIEAMAGDQSYNNDGECERIYKKFGDNKLREYITVAGHDLAGEGYKVIGEKYKIGKEYSYTPQFIKALPDSFKFFARSLFKTSKSSDIITQLSSDMSGGGFFRVAQKFLGQERFLNCFAYALGTFGKRLENIVGEEMSKIQKRVSGSIDNVLEKYFERIKRKPVDGDLVIYQATNYLKIVGVSEIYPGQNTHAGIYRESEPNWNSTLGGTVESKWGWLGNPYIFQHDVFFVPHFYGGKVKFYQLKSNSCLEKQS